MKKSNILLSLLVVIHLTILITTCSNSFLDEILGPLFPEECTVCRTEIISIAACTEQGIIKKICTKYELHNETTYVEMLGHDWSEWEVSIPPTETVGGIDIRSCKRCNESQTHHTSATGTPGLEFTLINGGTAYLVSAGTATSGDVVIPAVHNGWSVTSIGERAFSFCTGLTSITIPNSVTSIGERAFSYCTGLTSITIPNSVTSIGYYAFNGCTGLTSIIIPDSVTSIGSRAFSGCTGLTSIIIPDSVTSIGYYAFNGCTGLTSIIIPNSVTSIGSRAFSGCTGLTSIIIPDSVTSIGNYAFNGCTGLTSIIIPDSVTSIDYEAFAYCSGLTNITIPNSVTSIGSRAFSGCTGLTSIIIPDSVTSIGIEAFSGCTGLTSIIIPDSVTSIGNEAFAYCSGLTNITIPNSVTSIGIEAFSGCTGLTSIIIPDSVTSIGNYAFYNCSSLTTVFYGGANNTEWSAITIGLDNNPLTNTARCYYSETEPAEAGLFWRWVEGAPVSWGQLMVEIPAGTLKWPSAVITLSAFKMGKYEVTQEQYQVVMGVNPSSFSSNQAAGEVQGKRPVEYVTWYDAVEFCNKLSVSEGLTPVYTITRRTTATGSITDAMVTANWSNNGYRLPTEAQWEYACRAGTTTDWHFGNTESQLVNYAWYSANSNSMTHEVGKKLPNAFGLYDMYGNVREWCWDWDGSYPTTNQTNPTGAASGSGRVLRGGGWSDSAESTRSAHRRSPGGRDNGFGFRIVRP